TMLSSEARPAVMDLYYQMQTAQPTVGPQVRGPVITRAQFEKAMASQIPKTFNILPAKLSLNDDGTFEFTQFATGVPKVTKGKWGIPPNLLPVRNLPPQLQLVGGGAEFVVNPKGVVFGMDGSYSSDNILTGKPIYAFKRSEAAKEKK